MEEQAAHEFTHDGENGTSLSRGSIALNMVWCGGGGGGNQLPSHLPCGFPSVLCQSTIGNKVLAHMGPRKTQFVLRG